MGSDEQKHGEIKGELQSISLVKPVSFVIKSWIGVDVKCFAETYEVLEVIWTLGHECESLPWVVVSGDLDTQTKDQDMPYIRVNEVKQAPSKVDKFA